MKAKKPDLIELVIHGEDFVFFLDGVSVQVDSLLLDHKGGRLEYDGCIFATRGGTTEFWELGGRFWFHRVKSPNAIRKPLDAATQRLADLLRAYGEPEDLRGFARALNSKGGGPEAARVYFRELVGFHPHLAFLENEGLPSNGKT